VFYESVDFDVLRQAKFSFVEKLEDLGCMSLFNVNYEVYPQLVQLFCANFEKVEHEGKGTTYYKTKVKDNIVTFATTSIERIFYLNPHSSKFLLSMLTTKARKLCFEKYAHRSTIKKSNQFYTTLLSNPRILYYI